jgi:hypothetical protein
MFVRCGPVTHHINIILIVKNSFHGCFIVWSFIISHLFYSKITSPDFVQIPDT